MELKKTLAKNIKILMKRAGVSSQTQLAQISGVSQSQIGNILRHDKGVSINIVERLARGLNCEPWLLFLPTDYLKNEKIENFLPMMHCYMKLNEKTQNSLWQITYDLYDASRTLYPPED